jgi:toxin ParE1/3/4
MAQFRLTVQAEEDFDGIGAYTEETRGMKQATKYLTELDQTFAALAHPPALGKDRSDLRANLLSCPCNKHVVFFRRDAENNVEILRILHERMDFVRHL